MKTFLNTFPNYSSYISTKWKQSLTGHMLHISFEAVNKMRSLDLIKYYELWEIFERPQCKKTCLSGSSIYKFVTKQKNGQFPASGVNAVSGIWYCWKLWESSNVTNSSSPVSIFLTDFNWIIFSVWKNPMLTVWLCPSSCNLGFPFKSKHCKLFMYGQELEATSTIQSVCWSPSESVTSSSVCPE